MANLEFYEALESLQSQYSASPNIKKFIEIFNSISPNADIELFYNNIFNVNTAQGIGLDIWGRIVGVSRTVYIPNVIEGDVFSFNGQESEGFDNAPFVYLESLSSYLLPDDAFRKYILLVKAFSNISSETAQNINYILSVFFEGKKAYVINVGIMKIRFVFEFELEGFEETIFQLGLINRPAGVGYQYLQIDTENTFGFDGQNLETFNNGVFGPYGVQNI